MKTDPKAVLSKLQRFCAYKERCIFDIRQKLINYNLEDAEKENIIEMLIKEDFINERRYTESFVRSKLSYNNWGRIKIRFALIQKGIPSTIIENAMKAIDEAEYHDLIEKLVEKKKSELHRQNKTDIPFKILNYMETKGFEKNLAYESIKKTEFK